MRILLIFVFVAVCAGCNFKQDSKGRTYETSFKEVCRNGVVYYRDASYGFSFYSYSPKYLSQNPPTLELCESRQD
jgi:hypothetical protein